MAHRDAILPPRGPTDPTVVEAPGAVVVEREEPGGAWGQRGEEGFIPPPGRGAALSARAGRGYTSEESVAMIVAHLRPWQREPEPPSRLLDLLMSSEEDPQIVLVDALYPNDADRLQDGVLYVRIGRGVGKPTTRASKLLT